MRHHSLNLCIAMPEAKWFVAYEFFSASMDVIEMTGSDSIRRGARVPIAVS